MKSIWSISKSYSHAAQCAAVRRKNQNHHNHTLLLEEGGKKEEKKRKQTEQTEGEKGRSRSKQNHKQQRMELGVKPQKVRDKKTVQPPREDGNFFSS